LVQAQVVQDFFRQECAWPHGQSLLIGIVTIACSQS